MLVADGVSDLVARVAVEVMVGFGGVIARERVAAEADVFITCPSLAPILPLALAQIERTAMTNSIYDAVLNKGVKLIETGQVTFNLNTF
jgi:hypothetical protein